MTKSITYKNIMQNYVYTILMLYLAWKGNVFFWKGNVSITIQI